MMTGSNLYLIEFALYTWQLSACFAAVPEQLTAWHMEVLWVVVADVRANIRLRRMCLLRMMSL